MKFKEPVDLSTVIFQDSLDKLFDNKISNVLLQLESTIQEFWNVDRQTANFLNLMIKITGAKSALEVGTSNGYSAIWLACALLETKGRLITIEYWEKRMTLARENFKKTGTDSIITPIVGDAIDILSDMKKADNRKFDFVFLDANKAEYIEYFNSIDYLLTNGGIIIADNILSHYKKTKNYVEELMQNANYQSQILNLGAGVMVSRKVKSA